MEASGTRNADDEQEEEPFYECTCDCKCGQNTGAYDKTICGPCGRSEHNTEEPEEPEPTW